jgi:glutathione S-transferase
MLPAMKLFGHPVSTCTRKVLATAYETQTAFDFVVVDFAKGEHKQAAHLARQPFGQVPALEDDGFELYESRAMARYVDAKAGSPLTPKDLKGRALMEQWMSVETSNFTPHAMKFIYHAIFKREQSPDVLKAAGIGLDKAYEVLELALAQGPYLVGKTFSLADICFAPYLEFLALTPAAGKLIEHPRVGAWWAAVSERPAWRKAVGR